MDQTQQESNGRQFIASQIPPSGFISQPAQSAWDKNQGYTGTDLWGQEQTTQGHEADNKGQGNHVDLQEQKEEQTMRTLFRQKWQMTITYCALFWSFGMCVAFLGPTLLDLGCMTSSDMKQMSWVFLAQLCSSLIGTSVAGYLVQKIDANKILLVNTLILPFCMFLVPFCKVLATLGLILALMGFNMGFIDCLANLQLINLYGENVAPFLHALHFCYGFGAFVSPMIVEPFLLNQDCSEFVDHPKSYIYNETDGPAHNIGEAQHMTEVQYGFWIMTAFLLPIPCLMLAMIYCTKRKADQRELAEDFNINNSEVGSVVEPASSNGHKSGVGNQDYGTLYQKEQQQLQINNSSTPDMANSAIPSEKSSMFKSKRQIFIIVGCTAGLLFIYDGLQSSYGGYVYSYAFKSIAKLDKTEGAYLNAIFWGMFALGRLLSIPLATRFTPAFMLLTNIMGCSLAITVILIWDHNHTALYVGTSVFGLFLSSTVPTAISLAELYIDINSSITSILVIVGALGEMISPVIVGNLFSTVSPKSFLVFCAVMCLISVVTFAFLWLVGRTTPKFLVRQEVSFIWCRMCAIRKDATHPARTVQHVKYLRKHASESSNIEMNLVDHSPAVYSQSSYNPSGYSAGK